MKRTFLILLFGVTYFFTAAQTKVKAPAPKKTPVPSAAVMERGKKVYATACLGCHQDNGSGVPGLNPPLVKTDWVTGSKPRLINIVLKGMTDPLEINGEVYENNMPAVANLTDAEIADVLTYIRNSFSNKATAVSTVEVKAQRAKIK